MSAIEAFPASDQELDSEPEPEPGPEAKTCQAPDFDYYFEEKPRNSSLERELTLYRGNDVYQVFVIRQDSELYPGEVHVDINGSYAGSLDEANRRRLFNRLQPVECAVDD